MTTSSFRHLAPGSRVFFGEDCLKQLPAELGRVGARRAVVFCGRTLARSTPGLATVQAALGPLCAGVFTGVVEQSPLASVESGVDELRRLEADAVVVLGGGSAVVTARAATIIHGEGKAADDLATVFTPGGAPISPRLAKPKLPQFIVPTTPTSACAKSGAAVALPGVGRRLGLFDPKARAQAVFLEPGLIAATPDRLVIDASMDAFAQGIQGLESSRREPLADALLLHGVRLIRQALAGRPTPVAVGLRGDLMAAALLIGEGTDYTGAGAASAIGHAVGARFAVGNGAVKAVVLPHTLRFNGPVTADRLDDVADALGVTRPAAAGGLPDAISRACRDLFDSLALPSRLRDLKVPHEALTEIADDIVQDWFFGQNPRPMRRDDLMELLEAAW
jgi:alcohol dehydrogenase class IV